MGGFCTYKFVETVMCNMKIVVDDRVPKNEVWVVSTKDWEMSRLVNLKPIQSPASVRARVLARLLGLGDWWKRLWA